MYVNTDLIHFILTVVLSFIMGLELKTYRIHSHRSGVKNTIGSTRTYTFLGMIGYLFYMLDPGYWLYIAGLAGFTILFGLFYYRRLIEGKNSILLYLIGLVVYSFGPLVITQPLWMPTLLFVLSIFILNARNQIRVITTRVDEEEIETFGKMVLLSAVILPLLPNQNVIPFIPISPFKVWLAVVVISAISYGGYILQKYFFKSKGFLLSALIGGSYSSTATTVVMAKKSRELNGPKILEGAMILATSMMYIRLIVVASIFQFGAAKQLIVPFVLFALFGFVLGIYYTKRSDQITGEVQMIDKNPLELGTAFIFALLFVIMIVITHYITSEYGIKVLKVFSFVVGLTDIDPFVLSLLTGKYGLDTIPVVSAIMIAAGSNNILKAFYALWFGGVRNTLGGALWLAILGIATISTALIFF